MYVPLLFVRRVPAGTLSECNYVKERFGGDDGFLSIFCGSISTVVDCLPMVEN